MRYIHTIVILVFIFSLTSAKITQKTRLIDGNKVQTLLIDEMQAELSEDTSYDTQQDPHTTTDDHIFINPNQHQHNSDEHDQQLEQEQVHQHLQPHQKQFWYAILLSLLLTVTGAFCSGMTVGFLSISKLELQVMALKKNPQQSKMAKTILNVLSDHHLFLVTLLVYNAIALESLPIVIHSLMPAWAAILFSTIIVLVVAEIIPQAYCTGQKKIIIAYYASPVVLWMMRILYFIILPIAKGLDYLLGVHHENQRITRKDLKVFLNDDKILKSSQKLLLTSTLQLRSIKVPEKMIDIKKVYMLEEQELINQQKIFQIKQRNYSHIIVYKEKRTNITGFIKVKQLVYLLLLNKNSQFKAQEVMTNITKSITVYADTNLLEMLMLFQAKSIRIAFICNLKKKINPKIQSIMYSKSDMIFLDEAAKQTELIGVVFLSQIFDTMADIKDNIERKSQMNIRHQEFQQSQMNSLGKPLIQI